MNLAGPFYLDVITVSTAGFTEVKMKVIKKDVPLIPLAEHGWVSCDYSP